MAISHFIITELPQDIISKIGLSDIILNQQYDIAMESNLKFERIPELDGYFLEDKVKYKAYDQSLGKYGNEANIDLVWKEYDLSNLPASQNVELLWVHEQSETILQHLPINQATEFIEVVEIAGVNNLKLNNDPILQGHRLSPRKLLRAMFKVGQQGGGFPYFQLSYKCGRGDTVEPTIYTFTINVETIATLTTGSITSKELAITNEQGFDENWIYETGIFGIGNGYSNANAQVNFVFNSPFLSQDTRNKIEVEINGNLYNVDSSAADPELTSPVNIQLNEKGIAFITIRNKYLNSNPGTYSGLTTVTLLSINEDTTIISSTESEVSITTPVPV